MTLIKSFILATSILLSAVSLEAADKALIIFEGKDLPTNLAKGQGLQLYQLLGHFNIEKEIVGSEEYKPGEVDKYSYVFFLGFTKDCKPSSAFLDDASKYQGTLIWLNTGILAYNAKYPLKAKYGFEPLYFDPLSGFNSVIALGKNWKFSKSNPNLHILKILDKARVEVLAEARSPDKKSSPYAIRSGKFYYFADSPLAYTTETDRYLFFADKLHDILNQPHRESHLALIRIEDVHPLEDPENLRKITDLLSSEGIPFLVSVIPFYVDPVEQINVALSDKPDMVDALQYVQSHGGTILMHGVTHQYHGTTAVDYEFWDEANHRPIKNDNAAEVEKKIESGVHELVKNGIFPVAWETPHYGASVIDYRQIGKIFSTAVEGRLAIDHLDYGQSFPYVIDKDMYEQKIYPENLGYVPLGKPKEMENAVQNLIEAARINLYVRDGFAAAFFHPFLPLNLLKELVEGVKHLGYTYIDIKNDRNSVRLSDQMILTGSGSGTLQIDDQYLKEVYIDRSGQTVKTEISPQRIKGQISRNISIEPGWIYAAEPIEYLDRELTFWEKLQGRFRHFWRKCFSHEKHITPAIAAILWNPSASGGAMLDQQSFHTALRSVGIPVDIIPVTSFSALSKYNLLIVPYSSAEILPDKAYEKVEDFVKQGGFLITDSKNPLAIDFGVSFGDKASRLERVRDKLFPRELSRWGTFESVHRINDERGDEIVCLNDANRVPVGIARSYGKGKFIAISARFDPVSGGGYARFPYFIQWLERYFQLYPVLGRDFVEVYLDPGLTAKLNVEDLVKRWSGFGIRVIHVAGWHEYPRYNYDYDRLIRLCHAYGITVYAWLEPPQISKKFYDEHPEWREKHYKGEDVQYDWRYPVALTDPACLSAATEWMRQFLSSHDWDGVNIAEIYFGGEGAPKDPQVLTPFHPSAREQFGKKFGFDPLQLFEPDSPHFYKTSPQDWRKFVDFRVNLVTEITAHFLSVASEAFRAKPGSQIILTILDQKTVPGLRETIGVDVDRLLSLKEKFKFDIQIEDPESYWNKDPRRYLEIGRKYRELLGPESANLLIDLNILRFRQETYVGVFPTLTPTGIESYLLVNAATSAAPRATIYSEATILPQDLAHLRYALGGGAHLEVTEEGYKVKADHSLTLRLDEKVQQIFVDERVVYPCRKGYFLIPAGEHFVRMKGATVNLFKGHVPNFSYIAAASCNILKERTLSRGVEFTYRSSSRSAVSFNKNPISVSIDGKGVNCSVAKEEQNYGILLPPGTHNVLVTLETPVSYGIDLTSFWSSELILIFGFLSGGALVVLFIFVQVKKRRTSRV